MKLIKMTMPCPHAENGADAIHNVAEEYWLQQKHELLALRGSIDIEDDSQAFRALELDE